MKKVFIVLALLAIVKTSFSQDWLCDNFQLNFEDTFCLKQLTIDTIYDTNNVWQIGIPQKAVFNSSFSEPRAILTDTLNPYPINDTSVFTVLNTETGGGFIWPHTVVLGGYYMVDSDSLNDYGLIEFSPDNGETWIDLINDTVYNQYYYWSWPGPPTLTGKSDGWEEFSVYLAELGPVFNIELEDTFLYRFTFISDSIHDSLDGLMFDNLWFEDWVEGIAENGSKKVQFNAYPNPVRDIITIDFENPEKDMFSITIFNQQGKKVLQQDDVSASQIKLDVNSLKNGLYLIHILNTENGTSGEGKFVVSK